MTDQALADGPGSAAGGSGELVMQNVTKRELGEGTARKCGTVRAGSTVIQDDSVAFFAGSDDQLADTILRLMRG